LLLLREAREDHGAPAAAVQEVVFRVEEDHPVVVAHPAAGNVIIILYLLTESGVQV
jgi:hypothetical protein